MILFSVLNNYKQKKFIEVIIAKNFDEAQKYVDNEYADKVMIVSNPIIHDAKGNLVSLNIKVEHLIKEEYRK